MVPLKAGTARAGDDRTETLQGMGDETSGVRRTVVTFLRTRLPGLPVGAEARGAIRNMPKQPACENLFATNLHN